MPEATRPVLRMEGVVKRFAGVTALDGVGSSCFPRVHALAGRMAPASRRSQDHDRRVPPGDGAMYLDGRPVLPSPAAARPPGHAVHQESIPGPPTVARSGRP